LTYQQLSPTRAIQREVHGNAAACTEQPAQPPFPGQAQFRAKRGSVPTRYCRFAYELLPAWNVLSERMLIPPRKRPDRSGGITHLPLSNLDRLLDNKLLASLPRDAFELLAPVLSTVSLAQGIVLAEPGDEFDHVYFPHSGMLSLLAVMKDGKAIETATVGREGLVGGMAGLGLYKSLVRVVVQLPLTASKISAAHFRKTADKSDAVRNLCINFNEVLLSQARVTAACNALHLIEPRFCRWLLQSADRAASNTVTLTQELLAEMLGVRRTSVTEVASRIQGSGAISYSRGVIKILDRPALESLACECYQTLLNQEAELA
jgi:CRP-like cAMP-binding protein